MIVYDHVYMLTLIKKFIKKHLIQFSFLCLVTCYLVYIDGIHLKTTY